ncbi:hypothetical protein G3N92_03525 [Burkholderia sp. Ac-20379]|nr:hypothetical protein [Burkholderia sp. Ac-20379]
MPYTTLFRSTRRRGRGAQASTVAAAFDPALVERAARRRATHSGPIARIVAQRAAVGADTAVFRARIGEALPESVDRRAFWETV